MDSCRRNASIQLISRIIDENHVDLDGGHCPSPQGKVLGISGQNIVEVPASLLFLVISRGTVQRTSPGGSLRKVKFISALDSPLTIGQLKELTFLLFAQPSSTPCCPHTVCHLWVFPVQFYLFSIFSCFFPKPAQASLPS